MKKKTFEKLSAALYERVYKTIPYLHMGGCGFAAATIIDALAEVGEKAILVSYSGYRHILVEVRVRDGRSLRKVLLDCNSNGYEWDERYAYADPEVLKKDLRDLGRWNDLFNRRDVPRLRRSIRKVVQDVLKPCTKSTVTI